MIVTNGTQLRSIITNIETAHCDHYETVTCFLMSSPLLMVVSSRRRTIAGSSKWLPDKSGSFTSTTGSAFLAFLPLAACQML